MEKNNQILSDIVIFNKYAKYIYGKNRRETWDEICDRYEKMLVSKYGSLATAIREKMRLVREKKVLMSMRAAQFAGVAITKNESRIYNCAYLPIDDHRAFSEVMFLLLGGTGVGFSVQYHHIEELREIRKPLKQQKYLIGDSIEGWADSVRHLMASYFGVRKTKPVFDFTDIRPKGSRLVTAGGKAPGPQPLQRCLFNIELLLERKADGEKLTTMEAHDIICYIADAVLAGGIRRAALISLFSADDESMLGCKAGAWWEQNPQRGRANNSAVILRHRVTKSFFDSLWNKIENSNCGEPGIYFSNDRDWGCNPCCEIALRPFQFCNLTEINVGDIKNQADLNSRASVAAFFGTLQAGFTNFHYLRSIWQTNTQKDALIGVGMTGICNGEILKYSLEEASEKVRLVNMAISKKIGISPAARQTTVKPSGTTSCVVGTSSGIHAWHSKYYIRRMQCTKDEALYLYLERNHPELVQDYKAIPNTAVIEIPQTAPNGAIVRDNETALDLLERVSKFNIEWVKGGHFGGSNANNVSATVSIKDDEWEEVREWMWKNKNLFNGLSVLPYDGGVYNQPPFEDIDQPTFNKLYTQLKSVDLTKIIESDDNTSLIQEIACSGGSCEVVNV